MRGGPVRKGLSGLRASTGYASTGTAAAAAVDKKKDSFVMVPRGGQRSPFTGRNSYSRSDTTS